MKVNHILEPFYTNDSRILILGTMPSPKSRELGFYYGHPQNKFWQVLADLLKAKYPSTTKEKKELLLKNNIALWDVLASCDIDGASDSSIKNPSANDIKSLLNKTNITKVFVTGKKAEALYNKLCLPNCQIPCTYLPSTSPANAAISYEKLKEEYQIILKYIK